MAKEENPPWWEKSEDQEEDLLNLEGLPRDQFENMIGAGSMPPKSPDQGDNGNGDDEGDMWDIETGTL